MVTYSLIVVCSPPRPVYVSAVRPQSKHIVVMVDHGASVTNTQLQIAKDSALVILNAIDEHDKVSQRKHTPSPSAQPQHSTNICLWCCLQVSILSVAETVRYCSLDQCYKSLLSPATSETKRKMSTFISNIKASDGATHHAAGFQKAFQLLRNTTSIGRQGISKSCRKICQFWLRLVLPPLCSTLICGILVILPHQPQTWSSSTCRPAPRPESRRSRRRGQRSVSSRRRTDTSTTPSWSSPTLSCTVCGSGRVTSFYGRDFNNRDFN